MHCSKSMQTAPQSHAIGPGDVIEGYEVLAHLAAGGMASIYVVRRRGAGGFDKRLALKVMHPHLKGDRAYHDMFLDEARVAARIQHPNVVHVFDVGEHRGLPYLVMELLQGRAFSSVMQAHCEVAAPIGMMLAILAEAAEGLHAAHETTGPDGSPLGIVHRDVSPQNVFVGYDGTVKVVDFGIAKWRGRVVQTETGEVKGKASYMAPEQLLARSEVDRRADVWAFGVVAWETCARRRLFAADEFAARMRQVLEEPIPDLATLAPEIPASAAAAIGRCLERDLERRAPDLGEIATLLISAAESLGGHRARDRVGFMEARFGAKRREQEAALSAAIDRGTDSLSNGERATIAELARTEAARGSGEGAGAGAGASAGASGGGDDAATATQVASERRLRGARSDGAGALASGSAVGAGALASGSAPASAGVLGASDTIGSGATKRQRGAMPLLTLIAVVLVIAGVASVWAFGATRDPVEATVIEEERAIGTAAEAATATETTPHADDDGRGPPAGAGVDETSASAGIDEPTALRDGDRSATVATAPAEHASAVPRADTSSRRARRRETEAPPTTVTEVAATPPTGETPERQVEEPRRRLLRSPYETRAE
jgi:tRNA A-37 threonylcarbamoyl transferase component Bud32